MPVGALSGINLLVRDGKDAEPLNAWYDGPTLVDLLGIITLCTAHVRSFTQVYRQARAP